MEKSFKQIAKELGVLVSIGVVGFIIIANTTNVFDLENKDKIVNVPNVNSPIANSESEINKPREVSLIDSNNPYIPNNDIWINKDEFIKEMIDVGIIGKFSEANLIIEGEISNGLLNFLSINVDYF